MHYYYAVRALELAKERAAEAERTRIAAQSAAGRPAQPSIVRRGLALGLAAVSRGRASTP